MRPQTRDRVAFDPARAGRFRAVRRIPPVTSELSVQTEDMPGSQVSLTIEVPSATVDATFDRVLQRLVSNAKVEGFRPGKAPRALVEARIGAEALREEVIEALVPQVVNQALKERAIDAIDRPRVDVLELERGKAARLTAKVSVMPAIKLPDLDALKVERPATEVTNEMVEQRLEELRDRLAEIEPVEREVRAGDVIVVDMDVLIDGKEVPSEARRAMEAEVKEGVLIPELLSILPGKAVGEVAEATIKLAEDHVDENLRGKESQIRMTVQGVKEKRVPPLTDDLAAQLSEGRQTNVLAFRGAVRADLEEQANRLDELGYEQQVLKSVVDATEIEVPTSLIDHELAHRLEELETRLGQQGLRFDRYLEYLGQTPEQWVAQARPDAESRLKVDLVLEEVGKCEGVEPTKDEVLRYMTAEAAKDKELSENIAQLVLNASARDYFRHRLTRLQILERLVQRASGTYVPAPGGKKQEGPADGGDAAPEEAAREQQSGVESAHQ